MQDAVTYYLDLARAGDDDAAFHGLIDLPFDTIPALQSAYFAESRPDLRDLIVRIIWEYRRPSTISFLAQALFDPSPRVWQQALDGLVALASPESIRVLRSALEPSTDPEFRTWLEEAIEQAAEVVTRQTEP